MYGHHAATDGELSVVPPRGRDHVAQLEDVAHPGVLLGEVVHTHLAWHVVPVVSTEARLHFLQRETWIVESFLNNVRRINSNSIYQLISYFSPKYENLMLFFMKAV